MSVKSHVLCVLRQGVWASLTGGWCYDPKTSILANTLHLYLWLLFFLLPLLLGLSTQTGSTLSWSLAIGYIVLVAVVHALIKIITYWLHNTLDTKEPQRLVRPHEETKVATSITTDELRTREYDSAFTMQNTRAQHGDEIEMTEIRKADNEILPPAQLVHSPETNIDRTVPSTVAVDVHHTIMRDDSDEEDGIQPLQPSSTPLPQALSIAKKRRDYGQRASKSEPNLEMPLLKEQASRNQQRRRSEEFEHMLLEARLSLAEANSHQFDKEHEEVASLAPQQSHSGVRRVRSSVEQTTDSSAPLTTQSTIDVVKGQKTPLADKDRMRKSYPSKTSSTDIFLLQQRLPTQRPPQQGISSDELIGHEATNEPEIVSSPLSVASHEPSTTAVGFIENLREQLSHTFSRQSESREGNSASATQESPQSLKRLFVEGSPTSPIVDRMREAMEASQEKESVQTAEDKEKLNKELAELLQELLKNPEAAELMQAQGITLDLPDGPKSLIVKLTDDQRQREQTKNDDDIELAEMSESSDEKGEIGKPIQLEGGKHLAVDHDDTTEGATHTFTDSQGNLFQYTFGDNYELTARRVDNAPPQTIDATVHNVTRRRRASSASSHTSDETPPAMYLRVDSLDSHRTQHLRRRSTTAQEPSSTRHHVAQMLERPVNILAPATTITSPRRRTSRESSESRRLPILQDLLRQHQRQTRARRLRSIETAASEARRLSNSRRVTIRTADNGANDSETALRHNMRVWYDFLEVDSRLTASEAIMAEADAERRASESTDGTDTRIALGRFGRFRSEITTQQAVLPSPMRQLKPPKRIYYPIDLVPEWLVKALRLGTKPPSYKLRIDRLNVHALFDRNHSLFSCLADIVVAAMVALLACLMMQQHYYADLTLILFCVVIASALFSTLKSVQPDASSPMHGYNAVVAYSRPAYFILLCTVILLLEFLIIKDNKQNSVVNIDDYGIAHIPLWSWTRFMSPTAFDIAYAIQGLLINLLLTLPLLHTIGLLPQVDTFVQHVCEQLDMHIFGGTATFSLLSSLYTVFRSLCAYACLTAMSYIAMRLSYAGARVQRSTDASRAVGTDVLFSLYCGLTVGVSYALSRHSTSPRLLAALYNKARGRSSITKTDTSKSNERNNNAEIEEAQNANAKSRVTVEPIDPLPGRLKMTMADRLKHDLLVTIAYTMVTFGIHTSGVFLNLQPYIGYVFIALAVIVGFFNHYLWPQLRDKTPWMLIARPILRSKEDDLLPFNESSTPTALMWFERLHAYSTFIERNIIHVTLIISLQTNYAAHYAANLSTCFLLPLFSMKLLRGSFSNASAMYAPLALATLFCTIDAASWLSFKQTIIVYYVSTILCCKLREMYNKFQVNARNYVFVIAILQFILAYTAPWQVCWGSTFHAFAQPFSIPHFALTAIQCFLYSAPLNPFMGSSFFIASYMRPIKFWEKDYNTRRVDHSNTRLVHQLQRGPTTDDSNFNAIFYEHLTRCLQQSLAGDLALGRWCSAVQPGDCFVLASYYLNCLVHIVEVGNGFVTFQLRGLEFRGTYCQQREVEAITEDVADGGSGCCCCDPGHLPGMLSFNTAWSMRWLAWHVTTTHYTVEGYSITDNSALNLLQLHDLRSTLVDLYVKCIIYYTTRSEKLHEWLYNDVIIEQLVTILTTPNYVDRSDNFVAVIDRDYDRSAGGVSYASFEQEYSAWIRTCLKRAAVPNMNVEMDNVEATTSTAASATQRSSHQLTETLCYALSLVARRALGVHSQLSGSSTESFLYAIHALFKGDFRDTSPQDEWIYVDVDFLQKIVQPAIRMALRLHQEHFTMPEELAGGENLYDMIESYESYLFISHEDDPDWRTAILADTPSLLALRHTVDESKNIDFKIIMLTRRYLTFRVIKINAECVRAFWAGQQQELIFLRNRNPERGSIQNAKPVLRNIINSSADQPIGYPIYVSPLTTSFVETHSDYTRVLGGAYTWNRLTRSITSLYDFFRRNFGTLSGSQMQGGGNAAMPHCAAPCTATTAASASDKREMIMRYSDLKARELVEQANTSRSLPGYTNRGAATQHNRSLSATGVQLEVLDSVVLAPLREGDNARTITLSKKSVETFEEEPKKSVEASPEYGTIKDETGICAKLNHNFPHIGRSLVAWPDNKMKERGGASGWLQLGVKPSTGTSGKIVHRWYPSHPDINQRSHMGKVICLLQCAIPTDTEQFYYVPVVESSLELHNGPRKGSVRSDKKEL